MDEVIFSFRILDVCGWDFLSTASLDHQVDASRLVREGHTCLLSFVADVAQVIVLALGCCVCRDWGLFRADAAIVLPGVFWYRLFAYVLPIVGLLSGLWCNKSRIELLEESRILAPWRVFLPFTAASQRAGCQTATGIRCLAST